MIRMELFNRTVNGKTFSDQERPPVHFLTLSFNTPELNREFEESITKRALLLVRISLILAIALYIIFSWLDRLVTPEVVTELMMIRIASCLMFIGSIYLTYTKWGVRNFQFMMSMVVVLAGLGIIGMILVSESIGGYHYYAGLLLAIMFAHGLLQMRFIYATITTWFVIWTYITATIWLEVTPFRIYVTNIFFLASANVMGMFASYLLEYYLKAFFWNGIILDEKTRELKRESARKSSELQAARRLQLKMLPEKFPDCPNYEFSFAMRAASEVGGDYYDYHRTPDEVLTFGIGDATGHGLQASVMVTAMKLLFAEHAFNGELTDFLKRASYSISLMDFRKLYMAFAIGRLNGNTLELSGAGMPPALIYRSETQSIQKIPLKGLPLGSRQNFPYTKITTEIEPGDVVLFMTDGLAELANKDGEMIGYRRLEQFFCKVADQDPEHIIEDLYEWSESWLNGIAPNDDMTFFILKRKPLPILNRQLLKDEHELADEPVLSFS